MQGEDLLKAKLQQAEAECERLRAENAKLKTRLGDNACSDIRPILAPKAPASSSAPYRLLHS